MKRIIILYLILVAYSTIYSQHGFTTEFSSNNKPATSVKNEISIQDNKNNFSITINSDSAKVEYPNNFYFTGNVNIIQGKSYLKANEVQLYQQYLKSSANLVNTVDMLGNVYYSDNQIILKGQKGWANLNNKDINIWKGGYQIAGQPFHGKAKLMKQRGKGRYTILENSSFTFCLPDSDNWSILGSKVIYDRKEQIAKIWNARFKLGFIPIFYSPYLQIPASNKRRSGFLIPNAKYSTSDHFDFYLPYYWNISPSMDMTIKPHYKYNFVAWENEFRYLAHLRTNLIELDYIKSNRKNKKDGLIDKDHNRWLIHWDHIGTIHKILHFNIDYTKVSDILYVKDFNSKYILNSNNNYVAQTFSTDLLLKNFDTRLSIKRFQIFNQDFNNNYAAEPQIEINWYKDHLGPFDLHIYSQAVNFANTSSNMPKSIRLHLEPTVSIPWFNRWSSVNTEAKLIATYYHQKNLDKYNEQHGTDLKDHIIRVLPQFKTNSKITLERNINWVKDFTQTLETQIQYLYIPYFNQNKIYNYDSSLLFLNFDYENLFRDRIYSGLDRIDSINQAVTGITTRIYDESAVERFNISIGQIYYFNKLHINDNQISFEKNCNKSGPLIWSGKAYWRITDNLRMHCSLNYNRRLDNITTGNGTIEYHYGENRLVQLNYHHANHESIQDRSPFVNKTENQNTISQLGALASWTIADRWSIISMYYHNTNKNKPVDQMLGVQYNSCCYKIGVNYERKINGWDKRNNQSEYNNTISFNIELQGLNLDHSTVNNYMLKSNMIPYHDSFNES